MKNSILKMTASMGLGVLLLTTVAPARAQQMFPSRYEIPFAFEAGDRTYPAGSYYLQIPYGFKFMDLRQVGESSSHRIFLSESVQRKLNDANRGMLRFDKDGDKVILEAIWSNGQTEGYKLKPSKEAVEIGRARVKGAGTTIDTYAK
jgi:hypothetical protein